MLWMFFSLDALGVHCALGNSASVRYVRHSKDGRDILESCSCLSKDDVVWQRLSFESKQSQVESSALIRTTEPKGRSQPLFTETPAGLLWYLYAVTVSLCCVTQTQILIWSLNQTPYMFRMTLALCVASFTWGDGKLCHLGEDKTMHAISVHLLHLQWRSYF